MSGTRASVFESDNELDVSGFAPKTAPEPKAPIEEVREIAEKSHFPSRQAVTALPVAKPPAEVMPTKRQPRRHRTGRTVQLNVRTTQATFDAFYAIADAQGWLVGETVEKALAALQKELEGKG